MNEEKEIYSNFRDARVVKLLKIEINEGEGKTTDDPVRRVAYFCDFNGKVLFKQGEDKNRLFAGEDEMLKINN